MTPIEPVEVDDAGSAGQRVAADLSCRRCQYNLRGMALGGLCPECGVPVALSIGDDLLCHAEPAWIDTVRRGVMVLFWTTVSVVGVTLVGIFLLPGLKYGLTPVLVSGGYGIGIVVGQWLATTPDPSGRGEDRYGTARRWVRLTAAAGAVHVVVNFAQRTMHFPPPAHLAITSAGQALSAVSVVGTVVTLQYLGKLAGRIPDATLARRAGQLRFGLGLPIGCMWLFEASVMIATLTGSRAALRGWPTGVLGLVAILLIVFGLAYLTFLGQLTNRLADQADAAERAWAAGQLAPSPPTA